MGRRYITTHGRRRNMSPTVRIPVTKLSKEELSERALEKIDEAISKLETALRYFKMIDDEYSLEGVNEALLILKFAFYGEDMP